MQIDVKVTARAKFNDIRVETREDGQALYRVYVTAPADAGQANKAVIQLLAKYFRTAKSNIIILRGATARQKRIEIRAEDLCRTRHDQSD